MAYTEKDFTLSWGDITIGQPNTLVVTRPSALYSFSFRYDFQGVSAAVSDAELTVVSQDDTRVVYSWIPDESLSLAIPDSVSGTGTLTMTVAFHSSIPQLSNPEYCTVTYAFTAYVPDTMRPAATLAVSLVNSNSVLEQWGLWVRGISCLQYTVEASAVGGASLKSCRFTFAGQSVSGFSGVTAPIGMAGTLTPTAVVTDSRGRTTTVTGAAVSVFDYQMPSLQTSVAYRCGSDGVEDSGGACLRVKAAGSCWPLDGRNTVTLRARYRKVGGSYGGYITLVSGLTTQIAEALERDATYEVELSAVDTVGSVRSVSYTSSNAAVAFHLRSGGVGAAFGKLADSPALQCAWDASFDGDMTVAGRVAAGSLTVGGRTLLDLLYPVGALYLSTAAADPGTVLGGTWQRIEDRFLLAAGAAYAAGTTGGQAQCTLTEQQLPPHTHAVRGFTGAEELRHDHGVPNIANGGSGSGAYAESWSGGSGSRDLRTDTVSSTHNHSLDLTSQSAGGGQAIDLLPPYLAVYVWQRIS